jgi:hypothetical protein
MPFADAPQGMMQGPSRKERPFAYEAQAMVGYATSTTDPQQEMFLMSRTDT